MTLSPVEDMPPPQPERAYLIALRGKPVSPAAISLVEDVLQLSALTSGQFPLASEPVLLTTSRGLLEQAVLMIRLAASRRTKAVAITLDVQPGTPEVILTDPGRLLQVLTNLLGNARKFVPADGGAIQLCVDIIDRAPLPSTTDDAASDAPGEAYTGAT